MSTAIANDAPVPTVKEILPEFPSPWTDLQHSAQVLERPGDCFVFLRHNSKNSNCKSLVDDDDSNAVAKFS